MGWLSDFFNPISAPQAIWDGLSAIPGSPEAAAAGAYGGLRGDLSWNPYSEDNSVWDAGAGGTELSEDPNNRRIGRTIGTAIGAAFTGGALGTMGEGAGASATNAALADSAVGSAGYGASSASGAGASLGGSVGAGAQRGALVNGGLTAAKGGSGSDILKGAATGAVTGGIGGGVSYANPAEYAGITSPQYGRYFNNAISSGVNAGVTGGNLGDALKGSAIGSGINYGANGVANWANSSGGNMPYDMPDTGTLGGTMQDQYGENSSTMGGAILPAQIAANTEQTPYVANSPPPQSNPFKSVVQQFLGSGFTGTGNNGQVSGNGLGNMTGSLMGLYSAWQKRKQLGQLQSGLEGLYGQSSPYAQQLRNTLARHDAASGRRSQVGPREVELQARLAGLNAQMAPTLSNIMGQRNGATNMGLYNLAQLFGNTGMGRNVGDWGQSLYNQYLGSPMAGANVGPQQYD